MRSIFDEHFAVLARSPTSESAFLHNLGQEAPMAPPVTMQIFSDYV